MRKALRKKITKIKPAARFSPPMMLIWVAAFAVIGAGVLYITRAATPGIPVVVDNTLPNPTNVKAYGDDRASTVMWDPAANAGSKGIIGYYVTWGPQSTGVYTTAKQTTYTIAQIQPLTNGTVYNVKVQSVHGTYVQKPNGHEQEGSGFNTWAVADGKVSPGATATTTASSARVDQLRTQMTGFFDDFNQPAGAFDELKWNTATSACASIGEAGAFLNNQFHTHNQVQSSCDRAQMISRPRATFDVTGRTEADPGVIVGDFDGVIGGRDIWYIDLIPTNVRKNGVPIDITSHNTFDDNGTSDPTMIRLVQTPAVHGASLRYYDKNKVPHAIAASGCPDWANGNVDFDWCEAAPVAGLSPLPEAPVLRRIDSHPESVIPVPNVRQHWRIEMTPTKIRLFINSAKVLEGPLPADFQNEKKYTVHSNLFSYNTGKDYGDFLARTAILHWDNFGFNGPAPTTVVHNYQEGGATGTVPYLGMGTLINPLPDSPRTTKINVPDPIASPVQARFIYTLENFNSGVYTYDANDNITINGHKYPLPNPAATQQTPVINGWWGGVDVEPIVPYADSIIINSADLKQGMNDVAINIANTDTLNVHMELEYTKGTEPSYTQPKDIFGTSVFQGAVQPTMRAGDSYLFVEQDMGLPSGTLDSGTTTPPPPPPIGDTTAPTVNLTAPTNNTTVSGGSFTASATASDNVGVTKVEFYIGNTLSNTDSSSPYSASLSTAGLAPGGYTVRAVAYDAAGNTTTSSSVNFTIPTPPDTTAPSVAVSTPAAGSTISGSAATISVTASDNINVTKVDFLVDGVVVATSSSTTSPYAGTINTTSLTNGTHQLSAKAYDAASNVGTSANVAVTVNNIVPDTTPPTVSLTAPAANATLSGTTTITATASDNIGVTKVEFSVDNALVATDTTAPFSTALTTTNYTNGTHTLKAKAYDAANNATTSTMITITINNVVPPTPDTTTPTIAITSPVTNATVSGIVSFTATASDNVGVTKVELLNGSTILVTDQTAPYTMTWDSTSVGDGSITIIAKAYDAAGNTKTASVTLTVKNTVTLKPGDVNNDTKVDIFDLSILLTNYAKTSGATRSLGDLNGDGKIDIFDLSILLGAWGK